MLNGSVVDVGISQRSELPLISPQDSQDSGQKKKWETARLQHAQHVIKNKWLLLVGDGGKTQTKSESVARCQYTAYSRCLSLSRTYSQTESEKACKPCSGEPSFRYTYVCLSQIHTSHYIFFYMMIYIYIFIYLRTTCCLLCAFAQVHAEIEIDLPLLRPARYRIHQFYKLRSNKVP